MADVIVMTTAGREFWANALLGEGPAAADEQRLMLFTNEPDPFDATLAEEDLEAALFTGYAEKVIEYGSNGTPVLNAGRYEVEIGDAGQEFTCTAGTETVRGWALIDSTTGVLTYACLYEFPVVMIPDATHTADVKISVGP